jgi:SNF family Na+-dependent transporter
MYYLSFQASFSRYRNNIYRDAVWLVAMYANFLHNSTLLIPKNSDTLTSVLCGMVIFSFIGFMTTAQGIQISDIQSQAKNALLLPKMPFIRAVPLCLAELDPTYIAFTVYPGVTSYLEWGFVWAILFYSILTLSALDAEFAWYF